LNSTTTADHHMQGLYRKRAKVRVVAENFSLTRRANINNAGCKQGGAKNFRLAADPLPRGAGRLKFNQLEMVTTFTYKPSLVKIDARNFE